MSVHAPYGRERIRKGAIQFLLGKVLSSIAGMAVLVLLVRHLTVSEFAAYSVLQAFVYVFTAVTGFGLLHVTLRYIPELYAQHKRHTLRGFVLWTIGLRLVLLTLATIAVYGAGRQIADVFGLAGWVQVFQAYLIVVWLRVNSHFLFQILESTLHQGLGQAAFVATILLKLIFIYWLMAVNEMKLLNVVWAELTAELIGMLIFSIGVIMVQRETRVENDSADLSSWWSGNSRRVIRYGAAGYLQQLVILPYGSAPNRLVIGHFMGAASIAAFGFAQSFIDVINRYLPAQLLGGLIRPVVVAKFATRGNFSEVTRLLAFVFRINTVLLGLLLAPLLAVGQQIVGFISNGKYGFEATLLLAAMIGVLMLDSRRYLLDMAIQAIEQYKVLIAGNLVLAASLLLAVGLMPWFAAMAIPMASAIGLLASNAWIAHRLKKVGFSFPVGFLDFFRVLGTTVVAAGLGYFFSTMLNWTIVIVIVFLLQFVLLWMTGAMREEDWVLIRNIRRTPSLQANQDAI